MNKDEERESMARHPLAQLRAFWDQRYADASYVYGTEPNAFLTARFPSLKPGSSVLCLGDGEGRNGVWLAEQGHCVTSVDISLQGSAKVSALARRRGVPLAVKTEDVTLFDMGNAQWDAIVSIFLHLPPRARRQLHGRGAQALRPGGYFIWEAYAPDQLDQSTGGPQSAALLPPLADVIEDFSGTACVVRHQWSGWREVREGALHTGRGATTQLIVQRQSQ